MNRESTNFNWFWVTGAMPHSKNEAVKKQQSCLPNQTRGVDYASLDGQPTDVLHDRSSEGANDTPLAALAVSKYLMKPGFADKLRKQALPDQVIAFDAEEQEAAAEEAKKQKQSKKRLHRQTIDRCRYMYNKGSPHLYG